MHSDVMHQQQDCFNSDCMPFACQLAVFGDHHTQPGILLEQGSTVPASTALRAAYKIVVVWQQLLTCRHAQA